MPQPINSDGMNRPAQDAETTPFRLDVTDILDLHSFRPSEIPAVVETYLEEARHKGLATVRIIHGKGIGVQRERVRAVLERTPFVLRFEEAPLEAGGWGATIAWLKQGPEGGQETVP